VNKLILLVDDSPDDAEIFKHSLKTFGVENPVYVVQSGKEAMAYLKGEGIYADREMYPFPKILFLDLLMPVIDGWEVLKRLRAQPDLSDKLLVFVLSGWLHTFRLQEAYLLGAHSFLIKPLQRAELQGLMHYWPSVWIVKDQHPPALPASSVENQASPPG
jgi:CheY-like chemotaxis protein